MLRTKLAFIRIQYQAPCECFSTVGKSWLQRSSNASVTRAVLFLFFQSLISFLSSVHLLFLRSVWGPLLHEPTAHLASYRILTRPVLRACVGRLQISKVTLTF